MQKLHFYLLAMTRTGKKFELTFDCKTKSKTTFQKTIVGSQNCFQNDGAKLQILALCSLPSRFPSQRATHKPSEILSEPILDTFDSISGPLRNNFGTILTTFYACCTLGKLSPAKQCAAVKNATSSMHLIAYSTRCPKSLRTLRCWLPNFLPF